MKGMKLKDFKAYEDNNSLIGVVDVALPDVSFLSDSVGGAGLAGEIDMPALGLTESMTVTINFKDVIDQPDFISKTAKQLTFYGSIDTFDENASAYEEVALKVTTKLISKKLGLGTLAKASAMGTNMEFECLYLKIVVNGKEILEIDKINYIFKTNNEDLLADTRANLGM